MSYDRELADRLRDQLAVHIGVSEKEMFGGLAFLINGNMAITASAQGGLLVRVHPRQTEDLVREPYTARCVMRGREMDGWLRIEPAGTVSGLQLIRWISLAVSRVQALPRK